MVTALCCALMGTTADVTGHHTTSQLAELLTLTDATIPTTAPLALLPARFHAEVQCDSTFHLLRRTTGRNRLCAAQLDQAPPQRMPPHSVIRGSTGVDWVPLTDTRFVAVLARDDTDFSVLFVPETLQ
jgi:hypothetical protein